MAKEPNRFLGRFEELAELAELLERARLVTLTGAPGVGKTRLADELAERRRQATWRVDLAPISDPAVVPRALASTLSLQEIPGQGLMATVIAFLHRQRGLLVLDNCEHLISASRELVTSLLADRSELSILATSRESLGLEGERIWEVSPLPVPHLAEPALPETLMSYTAVCLFVERACAVRPGFALSSYVAPAVAEICRRLDGIPLAIELAAARVDMLTPAEIATRLDDRFDQLTTGRRVAVGRHGTLEAALDWSYELLCESERALLRRLSVFVGSFDLEAAEGVCVGGDVDAGEVPDLLRRLISKSLVAAHTPSGSHERHRLLETIRVYAATRSEEAGEVAEARDAHARYNLALAERAEPELTGPCQQDWFTRLESERENLRSAFEWCLGHGESQRALRLAGALVLFWRVRCHFSEGRDFLDAALNATNGDAPMLRAKALWGSGFLAFMAGDAKAGIPNVEESLALASALGDAQGRARALLILGNARQYSGDPAALALLKESADLARNAGDSWCLAHALGCAGLERLFLEELPEARILLEECVAVAREAQDKQGLRFGLLGLGQAAGRQGDYGSAESLLKECAAVADDLGEDYTRATALLYISQNAMGRGEYGRAREVLDESLALIRDAKPEELPAHLVCRALTAHAEGQQDDARSLAREALSLARVDGKMLIPALQAMAGVAAEEGDHRTARRLLEEALDLSRSSGNKRAHAQALQSLAQLARLDGDAKQAAILSTKALQSHMEIENPQGLVVSLEAIGGLAADAGRPGHAARLLGAATALREKHNCARLPWESSQYERDLQLAREQLSQRQLQAACTAGAKLSIDEAAAQASSGRDEPRLPNGGWPSLTETERKVAALVAEGMTNPEIAGILFVSPATVRNHLTHIFSKLGIGRRMELAQKVARWGGQAPRPD